MNTYEIIEALIETKAIEYYTALKVIWEARDNNALTSWETDELIVQAKRWL